MFLSTHWKTFLIISAKQRLTIFLFSLWQLKLHLKVTVSVIQSKPISRIKGWQCTFQQSTEMLDLYVSLWCNFVRKLICFCFVSTIWDCRSGRLPSQNIGVWRAGNEIQTLKHFKFPLVRVLILCCDNSCACGRVRLSHKTHSVWEHLVFFLLVCCLSCRHRHGSGNVPTTCQKKSGGVSC